MAEPEALYYGLALAIGVATGLTTCCLKVIVSHQEAFGETMMFSLLRLFDPAEPADRPRLLRGRHLGRLELYLPSGTEVGGLSWREGEHSVSLIVISRLRNLARRLAVPLEHYGAARRLLRDKIGGHEIHFSGTGLDLGAHDERDEA